MTHSRRRFLRWAASMSVLSVAGPKGTRLVQLARAAGADRAFAPNLLTSQKDVWSQQLWMAKLGPKYTGNKAHTTFVESLAAEFKKAGCEVVHDRYTLPRWDAKGWDIEVASIRGVIEKHPDVIKRAVAAITVEHLGCREWMDDASMRYAATGKNEW